MKIYGVSYEPKCRFKSCDEIVFRSLLSEPGVYFVDTDTFGTIELNKLKANIDDIINNVSSRCVTSIKLILESLLQIEYGEKLPSDFSWMNNKESIINSLTDIIESMEKFKSLHVKAEVQVQTFRPSKHNFIINGLTQNDYTEMFRKMRESAKLFLTLRQFDEKLR